MAFVVGWKLCFGLGPINLCLLLSFSLLNSCRYGDVIEEDYILYYIISEKSLSSIPNGDAIC